MKGRGCFAMETGNNERTRWTKRADTNGTAERAEGPLRKKRGSRTLETTSKIEWISVGVFAVVGFGLERKFRLPANLKPTFFELDEGCMRFWVHLRALGLRKSELRMDFQRGHRDDPFCSIRWKFFNVLDL